MNIGEGTVVLALETSCDETAAALVMGGRDVLSSVVASQLEAHARYGGVVPEVASRAHLEAIVPVAEEAVARAGVALERVDAVAATTGPGLIGALLVGASAAKGLAVALGVPFVAVNHLEAHLHAALLDDPDAAFPMVVLLVSGGHTLLVRVDAPGAYEVVGRTLDDAAGEAFDKVARFLGLGYPGGPAIDRVSAEGDAAAIAFPRAMLHEGLDVSFSGLKTAVVNHVRAHPDVRTEDVAASFQAAVVDVLVAKARRAARAHGARTVALGGGVAANSLLRARLAEGCAEDGLRTVLASRAMCTDNAAMIAAAAWHRLARRGGDPLDAPAFPSGRPGDPLGLP
ncbi:MAG: tRNA (adenosine(37)-N6)-threonylcarbamoyltransferase complex transferase subunit TsaD [Ilumatobacteraceae bacterium]|jgi:N6-L-threonylcarbamoyladenine synthase